MMGDQSSSGGTQVTRVEPPDYLRPALEEGLGYSRGLFAEGGPQQYPGNTVIPFSLQSEEALGLTADRARAGSPVGAAGEDYVTRSLRGDYVGGNPHLDAMFDQAARRSRGTLESEFARSGRNVGAAAPARADMLSDLATSIYGGAYDRDRALQQGVLPYVSPFAQDDYTDLANLRGVGREVEDLAGRYAEDAAGRYGYEQERPEVNLDRYLGRITGQPGSTTTEQLPDVHRNRLAGAAGGAALGSIFGPWGTVLGGLGGLFG